MARDRRRRRTSLARRRDPAGAAIILAAAPLIVCGALALALMLGGRSRRGASRTGAIRERLGGYARGDLPFAALREAIVGSAKAAVIAAFGRPRTALLGRGQKRMSIWRAETWYYPLDRAARSAIAIRFHGNRARDVEKITVPDAVVD